MNGAKGKTDKDKVLYPQNSKQEEKAGDSPKNRGRCRQRLSEKSREIKALESS